ncbi:MAG: DUF4350 domain-containing protein [Armatimonadetes bacterium]|nr:DUF4350 domain-containing protein [Armatimonadota bacterium]
MRRSGDIWILAAMFVLLCVGGYFVSSPGTNIESKASTSYNPDPKGVKVFYVLLGRLGYSTDRLRQPYTELPKKACVLIAVEPHSLTPDKAVDDEGDSEYRISGAESAALENWVRGGGTVIFLSNKLKGVPEDFRVTRTLGKGHIHAFDSSRLITNKGMRNEKNAMALLDIIGESTDPGCFGSRSVAELPKHERLILFDEYHHGLGEGKPLLASLSRQVKMSIIIFLTAALVLCYSKGRRFGAVRNLPKSETLRPGYEFVESVARLYRRAHATDLAAGILCDSFKQELCSKLGLAPDVPREQIARRLEIDSSMELSGRVGRLFADCERSKAGQKPTESELVDMAVEIRNLEQELGIGGTHN